MSQSTLKEKRKQYQLHHYEYNQVVLFKGGENNFWDPATVDDIDEENKGQEKVNIKRIDPHNKYVKSEITKKVLKKNVLPYNSEIYQLITREFPVPIEASQHHDICMEVAKEFNVRNEKYKEKVQKAERREMMQLEKWLPDVDELKIVNILFAK